MARPSHNESTSEAPATTQSEGERATVESDTLAQLDVPLFARTYPDDPALRSLVQAFVQGNYAKIHAESEALAKRSEDPRIAAAARDLRRRIEPDPLALWMLGGMALLLLFLVFWFYTHRH